MIRLSHVHFTQSTRAIPGSPIDTLSFLKGVYESGRGLSVKTSGIPFHYELKALGLIYAIFFTPVVVCPFGDTDLTNNRQHWLTSVKQNLDLVQLSNELFRLVTLFSHALIPLSNTFFNSNIIYGAVYVG